MSDPIVDLLDSAADYAAKLAAIDHAYILGDRPELDYLLSGVDPIDARLVANKLRGLANELRGATDDADPLASSPGAAPASAQAQASAPVVSLETYSRKVPCE